MEYIVLLGVETTFFKFKLIQLLSSIPNTYSIEEVKLILERLLNGEKVRFEFSLPVDKAKDFACDLIEHGFLIGESSIHEDIGEL